ncbi:ThuA domain-containing protein [bacterium]|nr:ThuA domain-containing protein [bacterium]
MFARTACVATLLAASIAGAGTPLRVLLLTGRNNHNWKATTPVVQQMYEKSGHFTVTVCAKPETLTAEEFGKCDVVVSNWSNWPKTDHRDWGEDTEKAFLDFVRGGGGFVVFHAAAATFTAWPEFQQLIGTTWAKGKTGHGPIHEFEVKIADAEHPVTKGVKNFTMRDELWHRAGRTGELKILCTAMSEKKKGGSGQEEPVAHWREFGKGRCFHMILGHDAKTIENAGWQALMLRGAEWAATGKVTIPVPDALKAK